VGELRPGVFLRLAAEINAAHEEKVRRTLAAIALVAERQAKINASSGAHRRGTPTPARPGSGPAVISGTLRRSITHTPVTRAPGGWEVKVGTGIGFTPPYGKTPASQYGLILEKSGLRNGATFPFLVPAAQFAMRVAAPALYRAAFAGPWPRA
jgi:hypothetical protein